MKQHHPLLRRMLCAALALAVACMGTPALAKSIPALDPEMTVNSSHAIYYGSEASLADGVYGAQENVDGEGWVYVQTAADGTDNHEFPAKKRLRHLPALALFCVCFLRRTHLGRAV